ncbi:MAG: methyltransferase domain-containing protein [Rhodomicrobium sp.]
MKALTSPNIFDRRLIRRNLERASDSLPKSDFLIRHAASELVDRAAAIKRSFKLAADVGTPDALAGRLLKEALPGIGVISISGLAPANTGAVPRAIGSEEALPLKESTFDLIISALSLQLVNDLPGALIQIRRTLRPDGLFLGAMLGGDTLIELRQALMLAETETTGGVSPRVLPTADVRDLGGLLQRAGFSLPVTDSECLTVTYPGALELMKELRAMGGSNPLLARSRKFLRRDTFARALSIYAERFGGKAGKARATFEVIYLCGWAPHESQQKPLRPGSAGARLAEALGTKEISAGDKASFKRRPRPLNIP